LVDFLFEYGLFLAKAITVILTLFVVLVGFMVIGSRGKKEHAQGEIVLSSLNDGFIEMKEAIESVVVDAEVYKQQMKVQHKKDKQEAKEKKKQAKADAKLALKREKALSKETAKNPSVDQAAEKLSDENQQDNKVDAQLAEDEQGNDECDKKRIFVLDFEGDIKASEVDLLREEISAVLSFASKEDEIVLRLNSAGGMVHTYGLAASQLERIKSAEIKLTICVDEVAASGGYMMACLADKLIAAPFAIVGSIGVVAQLPNFNRVLKKHGVDYETFTAGEYKRTVTMFGENTEKGKEKFIEEIQDTHLLFKEFVSEARPLVDINKVATGEVWFGKRAIEHQLIDELNTSDDFLMKACESADVFQVRYEMKKSFSEKLSDFTVNTSTNIASNVLQKITRSTNLFH
jgi:serine protease SohB